MYRKRQLVPVNPGKNRKLTKKDGDDDDDENNALSLKKVEQLISKSSTYLGALYLDSFKRLLIKTRTFSIIIFCDNHWFCIFSTPETFEIFDPLGFLQKAKCINSTFLKFLKSQLGRKLLYANPKIQSNLSSACGYFVAFFIINRESGLSFNEILSKFSKNYKKNERLVKLFFNN